MYSRDGTQGGVTIKITKLVTTMVTKRPCILVVQINSFLTLIRYVIITIIMVIKRSCAQTFIGRTFQYTPNHVRCLVTISRQSVYMNVNLLPYPELSIGMWSLYYYSLY